MIKSLICHFFYIPIDEVEFLPITQYRELLNEAINIANFLRGGEIKLESNDDEQKRAERDYQRLKREGRI